MRATVALLLISLNTILLTLVLIVLALGKWLAPTPGIQDRVRRILSAIAETWISINNAILSGYGGTTWDLELPENLDREGCYLVLSNHRSWVDILVLQRCFNRRLPLMRFFLKQSLIRVPFLGVAWWALDFPFMRRYSREERERRPELKGRDLENAAKACEKLRGVPVAMMNFPEGTRFSESKRERFGSRYRNLLEPRIGGIGQVLYALGDSLYALVDVTIVYPDSATAPSFWDLLAGRVPRITVRARQVDLPGHLRGRDFREDGDFRVELERHVSALWQRKDELIDDLLAPAPALDEPGGQAV